MVFFYIIFWVLFVIQMMIIIYKEKLKWKVEEQDRLERYQRMNSTKFMEEQQRLMNQQIMEEQQRQMLQDLEFSRKCVTPFEMGGFDMTMGNSFNNSGNRV